MGAVEQRERPRKGRESRLSDSSELAGIAGAILAAGDAETAWFYERDAADLAACVAVFSANENRNGQLYEIYEGRVPLHKIPAIVPDRYKSMRLGCPWPEIAVQSVVERSKFEKFAFPEPDTDEQAVIDEIADRCDLQLGYRSALTDSLIAGVSFAVVGVDGRGACVRWHTAQGAAGIWDYAHGRLACGFAIVDRARKRAVTGDEALDTVPSKVDFYTDRGCWELTRDGLSAVWSAEWLPDVLGEPRIVALTFRPDGRHPLGRSRFTVPMRGIVQEYMANALNLHVASEFTAVGQKWVTGLTDAQFDALVNEKWKFSTDTAMLLTDNPKTNGNPQFGNFTQQSMEPILSVKRSLATDFAAAASIPVSELLTQDSNPTSADALTAMQNKLIALVESVNARNSRTLRRLALMLLAIERDRPMAELTDAERAVMVHMGRPDTMSDAARADAALKKASIMPWFATSDVCIEDLGYTQDQEERIKSDRDRYEARQAVQQAAQASGLDLSGTPVPEPDGGDRA